MKRTLWIWFLILGILLVANAIVSQNVMRDLIEDRKAFQKTRNLRGDLNALLSIIKDAETGQRGYVLVGDSSYLKPYLDSGQRAREMIDKIQAEADFGPVQRIAFQKIIETIRLKQGEMEKSIQAYQTSGPETAREIIDSGLGLQLMNQLRDLTAGLITQLDAELITLNANSTQLQKNALWLALVTNLSAILFLGIFYYHNSRALDQREALIESDRIAAEKISHAFAEKERAYEEVSRVNKIKDEFLAIVSHELRTPLNAILGWSTLLKDGADPAETTEGLHSIERNARAQSRLIDDLLDVSRVISGKMRLRIRTLDLHSIIESVLESSRPALNAKAIHIEKILPATPSLVLGDPDRIQQVVWNLVSNAIKFTPQNGRITVELEQLASSVVLLVRDNGRGISPEFLPHIFNRFSQADSSSTREYGGLGLGLAIVRHIVELHGGQVSATSSGADQGSTFRVELPVSTHANLPIGMERETPETTGPSIPSPILSGLPDLTGRRILLVDDQEDSLRVLTTTLKHCGASVSTANSAPQAFELLRKQPPDLLISDIGMPGENGYQLIAKVRALDATRLHPLPALALTAFAKAEDRQRALDAGYNDHLIKPVDALDFAHQVARLLG